MIVLRWLHLKKWLLTDPKRGADSFLGFSRIVSSPDFEQLPVKETIADTHTHTEAAEFLWAPMHFNL